MKVLSISEELDLPAVAAAVGFVPHVHRTVEVSHQVDQHFQGKRLRLLVQGAALECRYLCLDGCEHVSVGIQDCILVSLVSVYVLVVPGLCVGVLRCVAGVVQPVGPIDDGLAVEDPVDLLSCLFLEMLSGYSAGDIVSLLSPGAAVR